jgi:hypothetical protein
MTAIANPGHNHVQPVTPKYRVFCQHFFAASGNSRNKLVWENAAFHGKTSLKLSASLTHRLSLLAGTFS